MTPTLTVITTGDPRHHGFATLQTSLAKHQIPFWNRDCVPWRGFGDKLCIAGIAARELTAYTHLLFLDAYDTCGLADYDEVVAHAEGVDTMLCSAERGCWPDPTLAAQYPKGRTSFQYLNSGGWLASREWLLAQQLEDTDVKVHTCDQLYYTKRFLAGDIQLDDACELFQSCAFADPEEFDYLNGRLKLTAATRWPAFIHFNGRTPSAPFYNRLEASRDGG